MPFGVESGVGRWMGVLGGGGYRRREGAVLEVNLGCPIVTNGDFVQVCCVVVRKRRTLPKLFWRGLIAFFVFIDAWLTYFLRSVSNTPDMDTTVFEGFVE